MNESSFKTIHGQYKCGSVAYEVGAPAEELYHYHCSRCRRLQGALFATYPYVRRKNIVITKGADNLSIYNTPLAHWRFCQTCGCHLFAEHDHNPGVMWYMPATLNDDFVPQHPRESEKHIFGGSKSSIGTINDGITQTDEYVPSEVSITARKTDGQQTIVRPDDR